MEELVFKFDESEPPKKKEVITYEPVEKGIRRKLKDGKKFSYEATADFGRVEVWPGYVSSASIFLAMSRASRTI